MLTAITIICICITWFCIGRMSTVKLRGKASALEIFLFVLLVILVIAGCLAMTLGFGIVGVQAVYDGR